MKNCSEIFFCPLASGSKGNAIFLATPTGNLLFDGGISAQALEKKLLPFGYSLNSIDAILISHEHHDHISGLKSLSIKRNIPILANYQTAEAIVETLDECPKFKIFTTGEPFEFLGFEIHPFSIQHDSVDPVAFSVQTHGEKIGICTDLGFVTSLVKHSLQDSSILYLEANHKKEMVHASNRPDIYKKRVLSRSGHLSNDECAELLLHLFSDRLRKVYLAHLSSECNSPEAALSLVRQKLTSRGIQVPIEIAHQDKASVPTTILLNLPPV